METNSPITDITQCPNLRTEGNMIKKPVRAMKAVRKLGQKMT